MTIKNNIRRHHLHLRNHLPKEQSKLHSEQICDKILLHGAFKQSQSVAFYYALGNEVDLSVITNNAQNKSFYLPVIGNNKSMMFQKLQAYAELKKNQYGILEPLSGEIINAADIDLCLVPLVGFNRKGERLGMGGGYYDRYFQSNKAQKKPTILAGVAYDFQENATIQAASWDIPMDIIFTNKEVIEL